MENPKIKEIERLFLDFIPLYYEKLSPIFREEDGAGLRCHKNQKRAIMVIQRKKGVILSELGRYLDMRKGSLTSLIDSLVKNGLVERREDKSDRRKTLLYLTEAGEEYYQKMMAQTSKTYQKLFSKLSPEEIENCLCGLQLVVDALKKI
ncbi:MAG: MarR family transcriptional regulator [Bacillota bacterium]|jgi:DNA-binding MarR family transcriptional regulator|nr:MarR family transcriptional regulator [Bacillota bacterium]HHU30503.1 MarR family transcriptional regulator [Bacillota bacterium]